MKTDKTKKNPDYAPPQTWVMNVEVCQTLCSSFENEFFIEEDYSDKW